MTRRALAAAASLLAMAAILAGLPVLLLLIFGSPIPTEIPSWEQIRNRLMRPDDGNGLLAALKLIGWVSWASLVWSTFAELWERFTHWRLHRLPTAGLIPRLITGISLLTATSGAAQTASPAVATAHAVPETHEPQGPHGQGAPGQETGPRLVTFTGGMLAGGVLATLAAWRRHQRQQTRPGRTFPLPTGTALDYEQRLRIEGDPDLPRRVRAILQTLPATPDCAGVHILPDRVEILLNSPDDNPPDGFQPSDDGWCWQASTTTDVTAATGRPDPLPDLLALGRTHPGGQLMIRLRGIASCHGDPELVRQFLHAAAINAATAGLDRDIALVGFDELQPLDRAAHLYPSHADALAAAESTPRFALLISRRPPHGDELEHLNALAGTGQIAALVPDSSLADQLFELSRRHGGAVLYAEPFGLVVRPELLTDRQYADLITLLHTARQLGNIEQEQTPPATRQSLTGGLTVRILGRVAITGAAERLHGRDIELVTMLALHETLSNADLCTNLGTPDWSLDLPQVNSIISRTRKRLGRAGDGRHRILHYTNAGIHMYRLHDVTLDWDRFQHLTSQGGLDNLRMALDLVTDSPLIGGNWWWLDPRLIEEITLAVLHAAETLADLELDHGNPHEARRAAHRGLRVDPAAERLWRAVMRSHHAQGDTRGIHHAYQSCREQLADIALDGEPHPDTTALYHQLISKDHRREPSPSFAR